MWLALLVILIYALLANSVKIDIYAWMMLVGTGWFCGYQDCRFFAKYDQDKDRVLPPDGPNGEDERKSFN